MHRPGRPWSRTQKERPANRPGLERRLPSNTERGSSESEGLERKDAARRLAGTGTRAFIAPAVFSPNPPVTGSVIGNRHSSCHSFCSLPHQTSQNVAGRRKWVGTSNQDPLETPKVSALASEALHGIRPSSRHVSFLGKGQVTSDSTSTTPTQMLPRRTSMQQINHPRTAHRAGYRGTRNHHEATKTRWLETTPIRRPRVGQRAIPLSTPTLTPIHVP